MKIATRREFLRGVGGTLGSAALGYALAEQLGFAEAMFRAERERLRFGALDPLVDLMQATPADALMPLLVEKLKQGAPLSDLVAAGALANARAYGGTNYNGYHALMAMMPSYEMASQMPKPYSALPVLKVLHRNARFFQESGRAKEDALEPLDATGDASATADASPALVSSVRAGDLPRAEQSLAALETRSRPTAYEELQTVVRDDMNVHRIVLAWRSYDLLRLTGDEQSTTMLRQSVRFCIDEDTQRAKHGQPENPIKDLLPRLMKDRGLETRERGTRAADPAWIEKLATTIFGSERAAAAEATAAALAEGYHPEDVGAAMSLAATRLLLNDPGLKEAQPGKPVGSVHGASVGVHASDAANAWRHVARIGSARNAHASLIAGAFHTAGQFSHVGAEANDHDAEPCAKEEPKALLAEIDARIRGRDQKGACQAARRYTSLGHPPGDLFALCLEFAVSEDGALHAEKYFRTAEEEHAKARDPHKALYLVALTRVMASHFGFPAPGNEETRKLLVG
jgi:hypothetical protein